MTTLVVQRLIAADHPAFDGHFPGNPVLPGVVLLSEVVSAIRSVPELDRTIGIEPLLLAAKFVAPVRGGCALQIGLRLEAGGLNFEVRVDDTIVVKGRFQALTEPVRAR